MAKTRIQEIPEPQEGHDWTENGEPVWCDPKIILPTALTDVLIEDVAGRQALDEDEETDESFHMLADDVMEELFTDESDIDSVSLHDVDE